MPIDLFPHWQGLLAGFGSTAAVSRPLYDQLLTRYAEPWRHYHTIEHIAALIDDLGKAARAGAVDDVQPLLLAGYFHDVVYEPRAADNEERSAEHADTILSQLRVPAALRGNVRALILKTKSHVTESDDVAGRLFLDADLAILGASESDYDRYAAQIRQEYSWVPEQAYRAGRRAVLERFLRRPQLYGTAAFSDREGPARQNLAREIDSLAS